MLNAYIDPLCSTICWHNRQVPTHVCSENILYISKCICITLNIEIASDLVLEVFNNSNSVGPIMANPSKIP